MGKESIRYNFRQLWHIFRMSWFGTRGTIARLTPKRIVILAGFYVLYGFLEALTWFCFILDRLIYPDFQDIKIKSPIFIIGNPRSGTTFLHRLLAMDDANFLPILLWEIVFAPSIVQRKIWGSFVSVDKLLGHPVRNVVRRVEAWLFDPNKMHRIRLRKPEEDEYLMMHEGTTILAGLFLGLPEASKPFVKYEECLSESVKSKAIEFYKRCIQRHVFCHGQNRIFLSKNPFFTPKVDSLLKAFPDAHIIYLVRDPINVVPSFASMSAFWWHVFCDTKIQYPYIDFILESIQYWYRYPIERLESTMQSRYFVMKFDEMVSNPRIAVEKIYGWLGIELAKSYIDILDDESEKSLHYKSRHFYSLEEIGYTRDQILCEFQDVYQRWQFYSDGSS